MNICKDRKNKKLKLSQADYIEKVLQCFSMQNAKAVSTPLLGHLKLTKEMCPKTQEEEDKMSKIYYALALGSLIYAMLCTRPDILHAVGVVSMYSFSVKELGEEKLNPWHENLQRQDEHKINIILG